MKKFGLAIHGGAGTILKSRMTPEKETAYTSTLKNILLQSISMLASGSSALDAVELAVKMLEDEPLFNAGKGSVFNSSGENEMDATIMNGNDLKAGAVACIKGVKNPVSLARKIMENSPHIFFSGETAEKLAEENGIEKVSPEYFYTEERFIQFQKALAKDKIELDHSDKSGTVGAVALDKNGDLAAATSSGGMTNKSTGRIGDSAVIGAGTYADNKSCAVSCTGHGEFFIRCVTAFDISCLMKYKGLSLKDACRIGLNNLEKIHGGGGVIAVDRDCNIEMLFNTDGMYRACLSNETEPVIKIFED